MIYTVLPIQIKFIIICNFQNIEFILINYYIIIMKYIINITVKLLLWVLHNKVLMRYSVG